MQRFMQEQVLIFLSFGAVYIIWGSTYLANWYVIQDMPPFLMAGGRFVIAGVLMLLWARLRGKHQTRPIHWRNAWLTGTLFLGLGTGLVVWAEQYIESSMAALLVAFEPLLVVLLLWGLKGKRPLGKSLIGIALGVLGMLLLTGQPQLHYGWGTVWGVIALLVSMFSWAAMTIYLPQVALPASKIQAAGMQMLLGGGTLLLASLFAEQPWSFDPAQVGPRAWWSFGYLVVFGSIITFSAFNYLLSKVSPEQVSTTNYINPVIALLLGWGLNGETITALSLWAALLLLVGVFFITAKIKLPLRFGLGRIAVASTLKSTYRRR